LLTLNFNEGADMKKLFILLAAMLTFTSTAFAEIGSLAADLVYTPITPCRVLDTRPSQGGTGPIAAAGTKTFQIWGAASYAPQGGSPTNCGITAGSNVAAVAMNVTVVTPAAGGFITAYPFGAALPTAATVNFQAGDIARGNFTLAKVAQTGTSHLSIFSTSNADVVGDVVGFYSMPVATALQCTTVTETQSVPASFNSFINTATSCPSGYSITGPWCNAGGTNDVYLTGSGAAATSFCSWRSFSGVAQNVTQGMRCCRIPGR
jgi:hypothetical protein